MSLWYPYLLVFHSLNRWVVLSTALCVLYYAWEGWQDRQPYTLWHRRLQLAYTMVFHIQGVLGLVLYFNSSPLTRLFFQKPALATEHWNVFFFGIWHITCMLLALVAASVGASTVKRVPEASRKFYLTFIYTLITLLLVFLGMPWDRPAFRSF